MAFGISFGSKKSSGKTTTHALKDETTNQLQNSTGSTTTSGNTSSTGSSTTSSSQTGTSNQTGTSASTGTTNQQQTGTAFSSGILSSLESAVGSLLGGGSAAAGVVEDAVARLSGFDVNSFVNDSVSAAKGTIQSGLDQTLSGLSDNIGSGLGNNSMAALLSNRATSDAAASLAGVRSSAQAQAEQIQRENAATAVSAAQGQDAFLTNLVNALKGGTTTASATGTESQSGTTTQAGSTTMTGTESTQQQQQQQQMTTVLEQLTQLLSGKTTSVTDATETSKGKSGGGGFSLSL